MLFGYSTDHEISAVYFILTTKLFLAHIFTQMILANLETGQGGAYCDSFKNAGPGCL